MTTQHRQGASDEELGRLLRTLGLHGNGLVIAKERLHQLAEGFSVGHDKDCHGQNELSDAAALYALAGTFNDPRQDLDESGNSGDFWPWDRIYDKRDKHDRKRRLAIAAALCWAELDRIAPEEAWDRLTEDNR